MTHHPPPHPGHASDEPERRLPTMPSDAVEQADRDERIDAAIHRLFSPPAIWPPLFDAVDSQPAATTNGEMSNGHAAEVRWREPVYSAGRTRLPIPADSACNWETESRGRSRNTSWLRRLGVAACFMLGVFGAWSAWTELQSPRFRSYQPPPVELSHLYRDFVASGFMPTSHYEDGEDGQWRVPDTPITIELDDVEQSRLGIEVVGIRRCDDVHRGSHCLLLRVADQPVVVFGGSGLHRYAVTSSRSETLHLHGRKLGRFTVYELTPYAKPSLLRHLACEGPDCEATDPPPCGTTGQ